jgi:hypothetical protein
MLIHVGFLNGIAIAATFAERFPHPQNRRLTENVDKSENVQIAQRGAANRGRTRGAGEEGEGNFHGMISKALRLGANGSRTVNLESRILRVGGGESSGNGGEAPSPAKSGRERLVRLGAEQPDHHALDDELVDR